MVSAEVSTAPTVDQTLAIDQQAVVPDRTPPSDIQLHLPSPKALNAKTGDQVDAHPPPTDWMTGTWHVTHSTLPMWKGKANVRITYKTLSDTADAAAGLPPAFDDMVEYQSEGSSKVSSVHGISRPMKLDSYRHHGWAYHWRGKGWLMIASSHWEILGWGEEGNGSKSAEIVGGIGTPVGWAVTYFSKTLFTPAGLDIYSRDPIGVSEATLQQIKEKLKALDHPIIQQLSTELFAVPHQ